MKLSVHGSRTLNDERVKILLMEEIETYGITEIVTHAEPEGVCKVARDLCKEKAIPLKLHFLNFKYLRGAFEHRSLDVLNDGDRAIFIHDGRSKGTANELILAKKMNVPYTFHELEKTEYKSSVGFEITQDWGAELAPLELPEIPKLV
ncbi:hypothetical protein [uncultured Desulfosarcina sp.]|uniref:hypothetical protein n=1 Tax=uncultured Desulfosarcina sp. TaxID=218289 RepID=UPI0029C6AC99|nr:hypothetical protein [uncultured Desulfosarcina sp.]